MSIRRTSANTSTGLVMYCIETVTIAASNTASSKGRMGTALRSCTTYSSSCGFSRISTSVHAQPDDTFCVKVGRQVRTPGAHQVKYDAVFGQRFREVPAYRGDGVVVNMHDETWLRIEEPVVGLVHAAEEFGRICGGVVHGHDAKDTSYGRPPCASPPVPLLKSESGNSCVH